MDASTVRDAAGVTVGLATLACADGWHFQVHAHLASQFLRPVKRPPRTTYAIGVKRSSIFGVRHSAIRVQGRDSESRRFPAAGDERPRLVPGPILCEEQRGAIARAIVADPTLLMADEPTSDLDAHPAEEVLDILSGLNRNFKKTIILVTHDPGAAHHATLIRRLKKSQPLPSTP